MPSFRILLDVEEDAIVAFMKTLSDGFRPHDDDDDDDKGDEEEDKE